MLEVSSPYLYVFLILWDSGGLKYIFTIQDFKIAFRLEYEGSKHLNSARIFLNEKVKGQGNKFPYVLSNSVDIGGTSYLVCFWIVEVQ